MTGLAVNLVLGFLGAGKTTLVARLLDHLKGRERVALVVNEFGAVGIDGAVLEGRAVDTVELSSGCVCCTLKAPLQAALGELAGRGDIDRVIIEASGVAQADDLVAALAEDDLSLGPIIAVVDAARFAQLNAMLGPFYAGQVARADVVIVNKCDLAGAATLSEVAEAVAALNPRARLAFAERCDVDPADVLAGAAAPAAGPADDHLHPAAETLVLAAPEAARRAEVERFFAALPPGLWRAKGFMSIDGAPRLVQYACGELEIAPAPPRAQLHVVFVGRALDRADLARRFAALGR